jgi:hypothetical protein
VGDGDDDDDDDDDDGIYVVVIIIIMIMHDGVTRVECVHINDATKRLRPPSPPSVRPEVASVGVGADVASVGEGRDVESQCSYGKTWIRRR